MKNTLTPSHSSLTKEEKSPSLSISPGRSGTLPAYGTKRWNNTTITMATPRNPFNAPILYSTVPAFDGSCIGIPFAFEGDVHELQEIFDDFAVEQHDRRRKHFCTERNKHKKPQYRTEIDRQRHSSLLHRRCHKQGREKRS